MKEWAAVIPRPKSVRSSAGSSFVVPRAWWVEDPPAPARAAIDWLSSEQARRRTPVVIRSGGAPPPDSERPETGDALPLRCVPRASDDRTHAEGYRLVIDRDGALLEADTAAGFFYAAETLLQLLTDTAAGEDRPALDIEDQPAFDWRGMHLDVCRHFFPVEFICRLLDLCARYKLNRFHWHLTEDQAWRLEIPGYPRLTEIGARRANDPVGGYYTAEDVDRVIRHAACRSIEVVPEIELPGHCRAALAAYPELSCRGEALPVETEWGIFDDIFCAGREETFDFLEAVLGSVIDIFPGRYVHLGGDECPDVRWRECDRCRRRMEQEQLSDTASLHRWFVQRAGRVVEAAGKRWIGWDEICDAGVPESAIVMSWRGVKGGIEAARTGHDAILAPTDYCYFDYRQSDDEQEPGRLGVIPWEKLFEFQPIPGDLPAELRRHILGIQANVWTEGMSTPEQVEYMVLPRLAVLAEIAWSNPASRDEADLRERLQSHQQLWTRLGLAHREVGPRRPERNDR